MVDNGVVDEPKCQPFLRGLVPWWTGGRVALTSVWLSSTGEAEILEMLCCRPQVLQMAVSAVAETLTVLRPAPLSSLFSNSLFLFGGPGKGPQREAIGTLLAVTYYVANRILQLVCLSQRAGNSYF